MINHAIMLIIVVVLICALKLHILHYHMSPNFPPPLPEFMKFNSIIDLSVKGMIKLPLLPFIPCSLSILCLANELLLLMKCVSSAHASKIIFFVWWFLILKRRDLWMRFSRHRIVSLWKRAASERANERTGERAKRRTGERAASKASRVRMIEITLHLVASLLALFLPLTSSNRTNSGATCGSC